MANHRRNIVFFLIPLLGLIPAVFFLTVRFLPVKTAPAGPRVFFKGTVKEIPVYYISGRNPKPVLLIFGGIQGDEPASYLTADRYAGLRLKKGTLIVVPRLNSPAVRSGTRGGFTEDMNRLFHIPENEPGPNPDMQAVNLAKRLIGQADYVLNLHQGTGFYSPVWINNQRNPMRWGQSNVIDAPTFNLPDGRKLELEKFARNVAQLSNTGIPDPAYHFRVNNTLTASVRSKHKEQRKSLTYYALTRKNKMALGLEATKNCALPWAIAYLTTAVNSAIRTAGIIPEFLPSEKLPAIQQELDQNSRFQNIRILVNQQEKIVPDGQKKIFLKTGDRLQIAAVEAEGRQDWYGYLSGAGFFSGTDRVCRVFSNDQLIIRRDAETVSVVDVIVSPAVLDCLTMEIDGKPYRFKNQALITASGNSRLKIAAASPASVNGQQVKTDLKGLPAKAGENRNQDLGLDFSRQNLLAGWSLDKKGWNYRIEVTLGGNLIGELFLQFK